MRSCVKCGRIYPARALVAVPGNDKARLCGADALKIARGIDGAKLSWFRAAAKKSRLYDRKMCR
jgi:hypothetical protein